MAIRVQTAPRIGWELFRPVTSVPNSTEEAQINPELSPVPTLRPERTPSGGFRLPSFTFTLGVNRMLVHRGAMWCTVSPLSDNYISPSRST